MTKDYFFILWNKAGSYHCNEVTDIVKDIIKRHHKQNGIEESNTDYGGPAWEAIATTTGLGNYFHGLLKGKERLSFVSHVVHSILKIKKIPKKQKEQKPVVKIILPRRQIPVQLGMNF